METPPPKTAQKISQEDQNQPLERHLMPRPIMAHIAAASAYYTSSLSGFLLSSNGSQIWNPVLADQAEELLKKMMEIHPLSPKEENLKPERPHQNDPQRAADLTYWLPEVDRATRRCLSAMLDGIERYRLHPYQRDIDDPAIVWREGSTKLRDYSRLTGGKGLGIPILLVPSLINRAYILDLKAEASFARSLSKAGHAVYLLDWDAPDTIEYSYTLNDYIARLRRAIRACTEETGTPVALVGYCMGGLLALAAALGIEERVDALVLLATPWDFHTERSAHSRALGAVTPILTQSIARGNVLSADLLQTLFLGLDPMLGIKKFSAFSDLNEDDPAAEAFVALEDWLNDGVPLVNRVAQECLAGWYGRNDPYLGRWYVDGLPVIPAAWRKPVLNVIPSADRIVPPSSARALADAFGHGRTLSVPAGHIGMMAARNASKTVWGPILDFLNDGMG